MKWILIFLTVEAIVLSGGALQITQPPQSTTVLVGSTVYLTCGSTDNTTQAFSWQLQRGAQTFAIYLYFNGVYVPNPNSLVDLSRFQHLPNFGLEINNVSLTDGSVYTCSYSFDGVSSSAMVVVMASPQLSLPSTMNVSSTSNITCSVLFGGPDKSQLLASQTPVLYMSIGGQVVNETIAPTVTTVSGSNSTGPLVYTLTKTFAYTAVAVDWGRVVMCNSSTSNPFFTTGSWAVLNVLSPAQIVQIQPGQANVYVNDVITCLTAGNPIPVVTWTAVQTPSGVFTNSAGPNLTIRSDMIGSNVWNCSASNSFGFSSQLVTFNVSALPSVAGSSSQQDLAIGLGVGLGVGIPVLILILVIIVVCCCLRCRKPEKQTVASFAKASQFQPPAYSDSNQLNNNNNSPPPDYNSGVALAPVYTTVNRLPALSASSEVDIGGFGALSLGNTSGAQTPLPYGFDNDVSVRSRTPRRSGSRSRQTTPQPQVSSGYVNKMPDPMMYEMGGCINLSYSANDEIIGNNLPRNGIKTHNNQKLDIQPQRAEPRHFDADFPVNQNRPVPQPRQNVGLYRDDPDETYPKAGRPTYLYNSADSSGSRGALQSSVYYEPGDDPALRFGSPAPPRYANVPNNNRPSQFSPVAAASDDSYDSPDLFAVSVGNQAFDEGTPRDSSYRSNQLMQVLGASKSIDV